MYFIISSSELLAQLAIAKKAVKNNPTLPILDNFLFEVKGQTLTITASDLQTSIVTSLIVKDPQEGKMAVPARMLFSTLTLLPTKQPLTFTFDHSSYSLTITSSKGAYKLSCESAEDFPQISQPQHPEGTLQAPVELFRKAFEQTMFAASDNGARPELDGVNVMVQDEGTTFSAIGNSQLARYKRSDIRLQTPSTSPQTQPTNFTIPSKALQLLVQLFAMPTIQAKAPVHVTFDTNKVCFSQNNTHIIARLIESEFKPYENMIPSSKPQGILKLPKSTLLQALKMMDVYANKTSPIIKLSLDTTNHFDISALDMNFANEAKETHECTYEGQKIDIGFNARLLITMISKLVSSDLILHFYTPQKPIVILPAHLDNNESLLLLLAPMTLSAPTF